MSGIVRLPIIRNGLMFILIIFLSGCQMMDKSYDLLEDIGLKEEPTLNEKINQAITHLQLGATDKAVLLIDNVIKVNPKHKTAVMLKNQIQMTPSDIFKTTRFNDYQVKEGDTLGAIAHKHLNNSLYFVSLAKLNNIQNPSHLKPGTSIKIPLLESSEIIVKEKVRSLANIQLLEKYLVREDYLTGLEKANSLFIIEQHQSKLLEIQQQLLMGFSKIATNITSREKIIAQAEKLSLTSRNKQQKSLYKNLISLQQQQLLLELSIQSYGQGNYIDSAEKLIASKQFDNAIEQQDNYKKNKKNLIDKLHEQAIIFYRNHILDKALKNWQLIQQIQPDSILARKYILRTEKLIKKLGEFD